MKNEKLKNRSPKIGVADKSPESYFIIFHSSFFILYFSLLLRQIKRLRVMFKMPFMRSIAKRLVFRMTTTAERKNRSSPQPVIFAMLIYYFKIALYFKRAVVVNDNFSACHKSKSNKYIGGHKSIVLEMGSKEGKGIGSDSPNFFFACFAFLVAFV